MVKYYCNDCEEGEQFMGSCTLFLPRIAGKPKFCPVFDNHEKCSWKEVAQ
jgi:hypothetical protein